MNILDNLILVIFVAGFLIYCYRKKKLFFRKKDGDTGTAEKTADTPDGAQHFPNIPFNPQMFAPGVQGLANPYAVYAQGLQALQGSAQAVKGCGTDGTALQAVTFCKVIPWTFQFDPLPFASADAQTATADNAVRDEMPMLGLTLNNELDALNSDGYTVTGISVMSLPLSDSATRALFVLTCSGGNGIRQQHS